MRVYLAHDGALRVRIGKENLGSIRNFVPPSERASLAAEVESLSPENPNGRSRMLVVGLDGAPRLQDWITHAAYGRDDRPIEFQRIGRDISDLLAPATG